MLRSRSLLTRSLTVATLTGVALSLGACTNASEDAGPSAPADTEEISVDKDETVADMVPQKIRDKGTIVVGTSADYAPAEFIATDGKTIEGFEIDAVKAVGEVMGLKVEVKNATFDSILPAVGPKFDWGVAAFSVRPERLEQVNMITFYDSGVGFATAKGNPKNVDPENLCGISVAVQTGTIHEERANEEAKKCPGDHPLRVEAFKNQTDASTAVAGGKADLMIADSPIVNYAVKNSDGKIETIGKVVDKAPKTILVAKSDEEFAKATQAAVQKLIDNGDMQKIMDKWGNSDAVIDEAELNPQPTNE